MSTELKIHPYASVFPETSAEDYEALRRSIDRNGQREPIVLLGGEVLDGRTRYRACREMKIPPQFRQYDPVKDGPDPLAWVIDRNLNRRHLTVGQKAALAVELEKMIKAAREASEAPKAPATPTPNDPHAGDDAGEPEPLVVDGTGEQISPAAAAAKAAGVSERSLSDAKYLEKHDPERLESVKKGETSLHAATEAAKADQEKKASEPSLLDKTPDIVNPYRSECADLMAASHGDKFAEAVRNDTILRDKELREFMKLAIQDQQQITALVARGWKVREAVKFAKGIFEKDDPIRDLLNLAIMRKGRAVTKLDGHTILVIADDLLVPGPLQEQIDAIREVQAKPETAKPPINTVGDAMEAAESKAAKPGKQPGKSSAPAPSSPDSKGETPPAAGKGEPIKGLKPKTPAKKK